MRIKLFLFALVLSVSFACAEKPNIILIMADDLGYSDISCFGGEIQTPNIDKLANNGVRFSHCYVSPMCVTSRVALMSGMEYKAAGAGSFPNGLSFAQLLRNAGYTTSLVGKNHGMNNLLIGNSDRDFGFDHFYGFSGGAINSFTGAGNNCTWQEDGRIFPNSELPADFYATKDFTDYAMEFIGDAIDEGKPFFTFLAFNAPHSPLDAPERNVRKYYDPENGVNVYQKGWQKLREERLQRMKNMDLIDQSVELSAAGVEIPDWELLPDTSLYPWELQKDFECLSRSAFAGMVDNIDENIGRLLTFLDDPNGDGDNSDSQTDNTIIIFMSDNGGCYAGLYTNRKALPWSQVNRGAGFTTNYGWGTLSNTPFRYYKHASHEGGIRSPLIIHWPEGLKLTQNSINKEMIRIWDFYPTFLELAGVEYPVDQPGLKPLMGKSFLPLLKAEEFIADEYFVSTYTRSNGLIKDNWKIVNYSDSPYELYDLSTDPSETNNLAKEEPQKLAELRQMWDEYAEKHGFLNDNSWNILPGDKTRGWGYDRIRTGLTSSVPEYMSDNVSCDTKLSLTFMGKISFAGTDKKFIRLHKYGVPGIIWSSDPTVNNYYQNKTKIIFEDFPILDPDSHYYITWDKGWVKYEQEGTMKPVLDVRESAYAFRFKTQGNVSSIITSDPDLNKVVVYPNPASDMIQFEIPDPSNDLNVEVFNCVGVRVFSDKINKSTISIDTSAWMTGLYYMNIFGQNTSSVKKILVL